MFPNEQILWMIAQAQHREKLEKARLQTLIAEENSARGEPWQRLSHKIGGWLVHMGEALQANQTAGKLANDNS